MCIYKTKQLDIQIKKELKTGKNQKNTKLSEHFQNVLEKS